MITKQMASIAKVVAQVTSQGNKQYIEEMAAKHTSVTISNAKTIQEWCERTPLHDHINAVPISDKWMDEFWKDVHPYNKRTTMDYYKVYENKNKSKLSNLDATKKGVKKMEWINVKDVLLSNFDTQRTHLTVLKLLKECLRRAVHFNFKKTAIKIAEFEGKQYVVDGGGTCISAHLRGIEQVPAMLVEVDSIEELRDLFQEINLKQNRPGPYDMFKSRLGDRDPMARLQDKVMERAGVHGMKNNPQGLWTMELSPLEKMLKAHFDNDDSSSPSGDTAEQVKNPNLFLTRKAPNIVDVLQTLQSVFHDDNKKEIKAGVFRAAVDFKGTFNGLVPMKKIEEMLNGYKAGKIMFPLDELGDENIRGNADFSNQGKLSASLNLTRLETETNWGTFCFGKMWNYYYQNDDTQHTINDNFFKALLNTKKRQKYDENKLYQVSF